MKLIFVQCLLWSYRTDFVVLSHTDLIKCKIYISATLSGNEREQEEKRKEF